MIKLHKLKNSNYNLWDDFVTNHYPSLYALKTKWKSFIEETFTYKSNYFYFTKDKEIVGILPLFKITSILCGNRFVSVPFTDCGGFYFSKNLSTTEKNEAFDLIKNLKLSLPFDFRGTDKDSCAFLENTQDFKCYSPYLQMEIDLTKTISEIENNFNQNIKRNIKAGSDISIEKTENIDDNSYLLYLKEMKKFGSPPLKMSFFKNQKIHLKENLLVFSAFYKEQLVGTLTCISAGSTLYADIIMSDEKYQKLHPKHKLYEHAIQYAKAHDFKNFNFSRTRKNTGVYEHKRRWGAKEKSIYRTYSQSAKKIIVDEKSIKVKITSLLFKNIPLAILKTSGPILRKHLGQ